MNPLPTAPTRLRLAGLLVMLLAAAAVQGESETQRLERLREEIGDVQQRLSSDRQRLSAEQTALKTVEQDIAALGRRLRTLGQRVAEQQQALGHARNDVRQLSDTLTRHRSQLGLQLRTHYRAGQQETLKLLFNLNQPAQVGRNLTYYTYLNQARLDAINETQHTLAQMDDAKARLEQETQQLLDLQTKQQSQRDTLKKQLKNREALVAKLDRNIENQEQTLTRLVEDEKRLSAIVKELNARPKAPIVTHAKLGAKKGKLDWPTDGRIVHGFGAARSQGKLKWQGVLIDGEPGEDIQAIAPGQVIFADWIRGYGLTLIVDHGDDYMSIYGHNQSLFKDIGDTVSGREIIASIGSSGGSAQHGLYFEMRYRGKPVDPARWCR